MKMQAEGRAIELDGFDAPVKEFKIKNSPMAFKILSDKLYSDKPLAVIREVGCNAYDSHVSAGKADVPFRVHLPNQFEPYLSIRDFGTGMSNHDIENLFTTYFGSTKNDSNDVIGGLGLGSKSPFSYVDQFTVISHFNGVKTTFTAFLAQNGTPSIMQIDQEDTDEENGLDIQMPVEPADFSTFADRARKVFHRFPVPPIITGNKDADLTQVRYVLSGGSWKLRDDTDERYRYGEHRYCYAIQGVVAYPINLSKISVNMSSLARQLLENMPLDIYFPIGDLDITPSREDLSYDTRTQANIVAAIEKVIIEVPELAKSVLEKAKTIWEAKKLYADWMGEGSTQSRFMRNVLGNKLLWKDEEIKSSSIQFCMYDRAAAVAKQANLFDKNNTLSDEEFVKLLTSASIETWGNVAYFSAHSINRASSPRSLKASVSTKPVIDVAQKNVVVVMDEAKIMKKLSASVLHNFEDKGGVNVFVIRPSDMKFVPQILAQIEGCDCVVLSSTLEEPPVEVKDKTATPKVIRKLFKVESITNWHSNSTPFELKEDVEHDMNEGGVYFVMYNKEPLYPGDEFKTFSGANAESYNCGNLAGSFLWHAARQGLLSKPDGTLIDNFFALNSSHRHAVKDNPKWVNVYDLLKEKISKAVVDPQFRKMIEDFETYNRLMEDTIFFQILQKSKILDEVTPIKTNSKFLSLYKTAIELRDRINGYVKTQFFRPNWDVTSRYDIIKPRQTLLKLTEQLFPDIKKLPENTKSEPFIQKYLGEFNKSYPLLDSILGNTRAGIKREAEKKSVAHYINLCDAQPSLVGKFND